MNGNAETSVTYIYIVFPENSTRFKLYISRGSGCVRLFVHLLCEWIQKLLYLLIKSFPKNN